MDKLALRHTFKSFFGNTLNVAIIFSVLFATMRGVGMLGTSSDRFLLPLGFLLMIALPFIFLKRNGRRQIGFTKSKTPYDYLLGIAFGALAALFCYLIGFLLFGVSTENWFITIRNSYYTTFPTEGISLWQLFFTFTIPALVFSPIGEEIFFRGFLQESLATKFSYKTSIIIESMLFGGIHIFHHGLIRDVNGIQFFWTSGILWMTLMFCTACGFAIIRKRSNSVYPAMVAHASFNLVMNATIFFILWRK